MSVGTVSTSIATAAYDAHRQAQEPAAAAAKPAVKPAPLDVKIAEEDGPIRSSHPTMGTVLDTYL